MTYQTLLFEQSGPITRITLNRPDAANGMNDAMTAELADAAARCDTAETKVVILTGAGRFFCAGGDLKAISASPLGPGQFVKGIADDLHVAIARLARMDAVLITAVNGTAAGAGFSLAIAGDLVVAASSASFTMAYTRAGLSPDGSASYYLPRIVGIRRAHDLMLTNRKLTAADAEQWGLVNYVVDDAEFTAKVDALAAEIARGAKGSSAAVKKLLLTSLDNTIEDQMDRESEFISANADGADGREGIDAFLNKRAPRFA